MNNTLKKLEELQYKFHTPYPYLDFDTMHNDYHIEFDKLSEAEGDIFHLFNSYCSMIIKAINQILKNKEITTNQIIVLQHSFFDYFKQFKFLESEILHYPDFYKDYKYFEEARHLLLKYIMKNN